MKAMMWLCLALALVTALVYVFLITGVMQVKPGSGGAPGSFFVIPALYVAGGGLLFLKKRWLLIIGAVCNAIPITFFYIVYAGRPDIMTCAAGVISKIAQVLLEAGLIYLIVKIKPAKKAAAK